MEVNGQFQCQRQFTPKETADCKQSIGHWVCSRDGLDAVEKKRILAPRAPMEQNVGRDSSVGIITHYRLDGPGERIPVVARFSTPVQMGSGAHRASTTMGTGSFPKIKRHVRSLDHPPLSRVKVKEGVEQYLYYSCGPPCAFYSELLWKRIPVSKSPNRYRSTNQREVNKHFN